MNDVINDKSHNITFKSMILSEEEPALHQGHLSPPVTRAKLARKRSNDTELNDSPAHKHHRNIQQQPAAMDIDQTARPPPSVVIQNKASDMLCDLTATPVNNQNSTLGPSGDAFATISIISGGSGGFVQGVQSGLKAAPAVVNTKSALPDTDMAGLPLRGRRHDQPHVATKSRKAVATGSGGTFTSMYRGVTKHRLTGRYEAHFWDASFVRDKVNNKSRRSRGRQVYLGGYADEKQAAKAYDLAAIAFLGPQNATTNFALEEYQTQIADMTGKSPDEVVGELRRSSVGFARGQSAYRGVTKHTQNRWEARLGKVANFTSFLYLGTFSNPEDAARAYDRAAVKYKGKRATTNFPLSDYKHIMDDPDSYNIETDVQSALLLMESAAAAGSSRGASTPSCFKGRRKAIRDRPAGNTRRKPKPRWGARGDHHEDTTDTEDEIGDEDWDKDEPVVLWKPKRGRRQQRDASKQKRGVFNDNKGKYVDTIEQHQVGKGGSARGGLQMMTEQQNTGVPIQATNQQLSQEQHDMMVQMHNANVAAHMHNLQRQIQLFQQHHQQQHAADVTAAANVPGQTGQSVPLIPLAFPGVGFQVMNLPLQFDATETQQTHPFTGPFWQQVKPCELLNVQQQNDGIGSPLAHYAENLHHTVQQFSLNTSSPLAAALEQQHQRQLKDQGNGDLLSPGIAATLGTIHCSGGGGSLSPLAKCLLSPLGLTGDPSAWKEESPAGDGNNNDKHCVIPPPTSDNEFWSAMNWLEALEIDALENIPGGTTEDANHV